MGVPVSRVVRQVVTEHAPQERELLDAVERMTPRARRRHLEASRERRQEPSTVDFGLEVVVPLVTPVLWLVLTEAARETAATAVRASAQAARSGWRRFRGRGREPEGEPEITLPLSAEQLGVVREAVLTQCVETGLSAARATAIANAVFYELSTSAGREEPSGQGESGRADESSGRDESSERDESLGQGGAAGRDATPDGDDGGGREPR
ncbi:hypothetical protein AB0K93_14640 [Streptomyces sp. NPDC052676]|uniref:hypothetical protein n=1 Tax=Streptomyces sp. NPDC052676 TaxID=3154953 RepID=UPI003416A389